jgi:hypothetical protein
MYICSKFQMINKPETAACRGVTFSLPFILTSLPYPISSLTTGVEKNQIQEQNWKHTDLD